MSEFSIITAVLSGGRHLELRLFCSDSVSATTEQSLTNRFCSYMDKYDRQWKRYVTYIMYLV